MATKDSSVISTRNNVPIAIAILNCSPMTHFDSLMDAEPFMQIASFAFVPAQCARKRYQNIPAAFLSR
jgi:hypothetical protein